MTLRPLTTLAIALAATALATPALADGLVENVNGITLDKDGKVIRFRAMTIARDGKVTQLIGEKEKVPKKIDWRYDGKGRTMLPGMIDAHAHVMDLGFQAMTLDLSNARSLDEALAMVREQTIKDPGKGWLIGRGWNQEQWGLGRFPTAAELDAVVGDRPVWLQRVDGHAGWANSRAMTAAGVTGTTKAPAGGRIETANGQPSGIFVDAAMNLITAKLPGPRPRERDTALALAQEALLSRGVTAVADMGTTIEDWQAYRRAGDEGRLSIRIMSYAAGTGNMVLISGQRPTIWLYEDRLRMVGVKLYLDGALGSRGAWLKQDYADAPGQKGVELQGSAELRNNMSRAAMDGFQIAIHAIGDAANDEALGAIEELALTYDGDRRWRVEHAQVVDPADIKRFKNYGIIASMQPIHQVSDRTMAEARLGPGRLSGAYAWNSILKAGGRLAFGSDAPVEAPEPFWGIAAAITREDASGQPFGGWQPAERIGREAALKAYTVDAAYAGFADGRFGSLAPGNRADFILVDTDPLLASPADLRKTKVSATWIGGRPAWSIEKKAEGTKPVESGEKGGKVRGEASER